MKAHLSPLFWIEALLALGNAVFLVMTLLWKDWIELVFGLDPDASSGAAEWTVLAITLGLTITFVALARHEWRRSSAQTA